MTETTYEPTAEPEDQTVAQMICAAVHDTMDALKMGVVTEQSITIAIDGDAWQLEHSPFEQNLETSSLCHPTAGRLFTLLAGANPLPFEFNNAERARGLSASEIVAASYSLAGDVLRSGLQRERAIYRVEYANHEFVITTSHGRIEILGSFMAAYTVGRCIVDSIPYDPDVVGEALIHMVGTIPIARAMQRLLFSRSLDGERSGDIFNYEKSTIKDTSALSVALRKHAEERLVALQKGARKRNVLRMIDPSMHWAIQLADRIGPPPSVPASLVNVADRVRIVEEFETRVCRQWDSSSPTNWLASLARLSTELAQDSQIIPDAADQGERANVLLRLWAGCLSAAKVIALQTRNGPTPPQQRTEQSPILDARASLDPIFSSGVVAAPAFLAGRHQYYSLDGVPEGALVATARVPEWESPGADSERTT